MILSSTNVFAFTLAVLAGVPCFALLPKFQDVTKSVGLLQERPSFKWGGPCVADLDNDGNYDVIFSHHNGNRLQLFFGQDNGTFQLSPFRTTHFDIHGIAVAPHTAQTRNRILSISVGGGTGSNLKMPEVYLVAPGKEISYATNDLGLNKRKGRGRNTVFMDLSMKSKKERKRNMGGPDVLFSNFLGRTNKNNLTQFAYQNIKGEYSVQRVPGFENEWRGRVEVTDVDGDGIMELISIRELKFFKLKNPFEFVDATAELLPEDLDPGHLTVTSVAELDFDNDGDFDLYVARADRSLMTNLKTLEPSYSNDILLENRNGVYVDVSEEALIPKWTDSMGVTVGDFNNDGFIDVMVSLWDKSDMVLLNNRNGKFKRVDKLIPKWIGSVGNNAVAVDYDRDGKVDLFVGQGNVHVETGYYFLMKNVIPRTINRHYLLVHVANALDRGATCLHAVVRLYIGDTVLVRRIGSTGAQGGGGSFLDTVHFGLGPVSVVKKVEVVWTNGASQRKWNVKADGTIRLGLV